ncbi:InlB B-repeat-containing protein [Aquimarina sp. 2201CG5-10]|uniref:InlB B-repeat-containing protein n=1 Tax=Aquimarina callyspongiae TaxID=3098150 RepID=UPI002AB4AD85|nr:InlB B-repeat-containing protein [Aquimarina sp. 2201CG5-10]MDY8137865.1 InlB B-repeat-containing protein [Aquimarina sp. 2201CG5-10]
MKTRLLFTLIYICSLPVIFSQTVVYTGLNTPVGLESYGNELYIAETQSSRIVKIDITTGSPSLQVVSNISSPEGLALAGTNLRITNRTGAIGTLNVLAGIPTTTNTYHNTPGGVGARAITYNTTHGLYVGTAYQGNSTRIYKINSASSATLITTITGAFGTDVRGMAVIGNHLYVTQRSQDRIYRVDLSQANPTPVVFKTGIDMAYDLDAVGNMLYITTEAGRLYRINDVTVTNPPLTTLINGNLGALAGIEIIGQDIYVAGWANGGRIYRYTDTTIPVCSIPTNVTVSGINGTNATVSWQGTATATTYDLVYVESGQPIGNGTTISNISTNSQVITGLVSGQLYDVYVRTNCSGLGATTAYTAAKTFLVTSRMYVDKDATGTNDGSSWTNAFVAVESALQYAASGTEIWVADGTYVPSTSNANTRLARFTLPDGVKLYGGFNATETQLNQRDPKTNIAILSGDINGDDNATILDTEPTRQDNTYNVIVIEGNAKDIIVDGFTITGSNSVTSNRGAVFANPQSAGDEITATFTDCIIEKNSGSSVAGYWSNMPNIATVSADVDFISCVVRDNFSRDQNTFLVSVGNGNATGSIANSIFYNNTSQSRASCLYVFSDDFEIVNSTFANNTGANGNVISIFANGTVGTIDNTIIYGNGSVTPLELINGTPPGVTVNNSIIEGGQLGGTNSDPLFTDAPNNDYTLQNTSPAVNAGNNTNVPAGISEDLSGGIRIIDGTVDMGAYEYGSNGTVWDLTVNTSGSGTVTPSTGVYSDGATATLTATPAAGYQFDGWSGDATGATNPLPVTMDADKTITATFSQIQRTLIINTTGSGSVTPASGSTYNDGATATLTATPAAGWQFDGWSGDATGTTNPLQVTMDADKTITATFSQIQRTLTINTTGSGSVTPASGSTYNDGATATLTATPAAGWQFDGWSGDATGTTNPLQVTMDADKTVTATFSQIQRTLTINATGNGNVTPASGSTYNDGTTATLTATPAIGYQFDGWSGDATGTTNPLSLTMDADKTVTATFSQIQYTLVVNTTGSGNVTLSPAGGTYTNGQVVTITATANQNWQFDGWSGDASGSTNPLQVTINGNTTIMATFSDPTLGINDQEFPVAFTVYPNPVVDKMYIKTDEVISSIRLYSILGNEIKVLDTNNAQIDVSSLSKGVYFLIIETDKGKGTQRFIKR